MLAVLPPDAEGATGRLRPVIHRAFPFEGIAEAYRALDRGGVLGKVVLRMPAGS